MVGYSSCFILFRFFNALVTLHYIQYVIPSLFGELNLPIATAYPRIDNITRKTKRTHLRFMSGYR